jgi:hypothetical protein
MYPTSQEATSAIHNVGAPLNKHSRTATNATSAVPPSGGVNLGQHNNRPAATSDQSDHELISIYVHLMCTGSTNDLSCIEMVSRKYVSIWRSALPFACQRSASCT